MVNIATSKLIFNYRKDRKAFNDLQQIRHASFLLLLLTAARDRAGAIKEKAEKCRAYGRF